MNGRERYFIILHCDISYLIPHKSVLAVGIMSCLGIDPLIWKDLSEVLLQLLTDTAPCGLDGNCSQIHWDSPVGHSAGLSNCLCKEEGDLVHVKTFSETLKDEQLSLCNSVSPVHHCTVDLCVSNQGKKALEVRNEAS